MNEFKTYHPIVNVIYFAFVIGLSMLCMHPLCLLVSLVCSFVYSCLLKGRQTAKTNFIFVMPMLLLAALVNPAFNHEGVTVLAYLPSGNPLTLESVLYGLSAGVMIVNTVCWFSCSNEIMTSDKLMYLFGKIAPALSLILSMTLRFVPRFTAQLKRVTDAQRCLGRRLTSGNVLQRAKCGLNIVSIMTTWSLENAIDTADSMKSRGYGLDRRTAFSTCRFDRRDAHVMLVVIVLGIYTAIGYIMGSADFVYFPSLQFNPLTPYDISVFISYLLLCICPVILEMREARRWKALELKM